MIVSLSLANLTDLKNTFCFQEVEEVLINDGLRNPYMPRVYETRITRVGYDPSKCRWIEHLNIQPEIFSCADVLHDANARETYCRYCKNWIPQIKAIDFMIAYLLKWKDEHYELDGKHPWYKILKDHLPEMETDTLCWYSIVPKERLPMEPLNLNALAKFCKDTFENTNFFSWSKWVVESGKHSENPNPHVHALVKFHTSANFARELKTRWKKIFPDHEHRID